MNIHKNSTRGVEVTILSKSPDNQPTVEMSDQSAVWDGVVSGWRFACNQLELSPDRCREFIDIAVSPPRAQDMPPQVIDWWPIESIQDWKAALNRDGRVAPFIVFNRDSPQPMNTASFIWGCRDNLSGALAVWIAALLWRPLEGMSLRLEEKGFESEAGYHLKGLALSRMNELGLGLWHYKAHTLPVNPRDPRFERYIHSPDIPALVHLAALYVNVCLTRWQLVRVIIRPDDD